MKQSRLKIALDARSLESVSGGVNRYIMKLIQKILIEGDTPALISDRPIHMSYILPGVETVIIPKRIHWSIWEQIQLPYVFTKSHFDIYHATSNWGVPFIKKTPTILTLHDIIPLTYPGFFTQSKVPPISKITYRLRIEESLRGSDAIVCTSNYLAENIKKYFSAEISVKIIPMGVDQIFFRKKSPKDNYVLNNLGIRYPYLLNHGGIADRKNLFFLLKVFKKFARDNPSLKLIITGNNSKIVAKLKLYTRELNIIDKVIFLGIVDDEALAVVIRNSMFAVYPSLAEGFGMPVVEAMAAGIPVVASDLPEIISVASTMPIYIDPHSEDSLIEGMYKASQGISSEEILNGRKRASVFTWESTMDKTYSLYYSLVRRSRIG